MMRKAQASHILLYALTAVVAAMVLIFGYKAIVAMKGSTDKITYMNFRTDIEKDVDLGSSYGAVKTQKYHVPPQYEEICLLDLSAPVDSDLDCNKHPLVCDSWQSDAAANVFLLPDGDPFAISNMTFASSHHLCLPIKNGQFSIRTRGKGTSTEVTGG